MKTLVIKYTPREERSNTRKILDAFLKKAKNVEILDLCEDMPDLFDRKNLSVYYRKNYMDEALNKEELKPMQKMYRMTEQLKSATHVVIAFPMYNFSIPAPVKAWIDSVVLNNITFMMDDKGFHGKLNAKGLVINTRSGAYQGAMKRLDHAVPLVVDGLQFMGINDVKTVIAEGIGMGNAEPVAKAIKEVEAVAKEWYS